MSGGYFVMEPSVLDMIEGDSTIWEKDCMPKIAEAKQLNAYRHYGFWQPMDTLRDKEKLEDLWQSGAAPWKTWQ